MEVANDEAELGGELALGLLVPLGAVVPIAEIAIEREEDDSELRLAAGLALHATDAIEIGVAGLLRADWGAVVNLTWERSPVGD